MRTVTRGINRFDIHLFKTHLRSYLFDQYPRRIDHTRTFEHTRMEFFRIFHPFTASRHAEVPHITQLNHIPFT